MKHKDGTESSIVKKHVILYPADVPKSLSELLDRFESRTAVDLNDIKFDRVYAWRYKTEGYGGKTSAGYSIGYFNKRGLCKGKNCRVDHVDLDKEFMLWRMSMNPEREREVGSVFLSYFDMPESKQSLRKKLNGEYGKRHSLIELRHDEVAYLYGIAKSYGIFELNYKNLITYPSQERDVPYTPEQSH